MVALLLLRMPSETRLVHPNTWKHVALADPDIAVKTTPAATNAATAAIRKREYFEIRSIAAPFKRAR
jgi:hypothetical protein